MSKFLVRSEETPWNIVDDEAVLLNLDSGHYFSLNETARLIWELCDGGHDLSSIIAKLCAEYEVDKEQVAADVEHITSELLAEGLLEEL